MRRFVCVVGLVCLAASCRDTALPELQRLGPGTVRATVMTARPGHAELEAAAQATVTLVGSTLRAEADVDGNVTLSGILVTSGRLLFELDVDGDGVADQSRLVQLEAVHAGFGKDVNLGQLVLSRNATVSGFVKRGDRDQLPTGHAGISVFLPQLPQLGWSRDDGSFELRGVPEGQLVLSFYADQYEPQALALEVGAGQEVRVATVRLQPNPGANPVGRLIGTVRRADDDSPIAAVQVRAASGGNEALTQTTAEGTFALETLPTGVYALSFEKSGLTPLRLDGVLVAPGVNDVGTVRLTNGSGSVALDGGPIAPDAGGLLPDAGNDDAGVGDAGTTDAGGSDAGTDAGTDAGVGPVAVVRTPILVARGALTTLDGTASTGHFPLRYRWTQRSGPMVTLSTNDSFAAHSPTFTAPASAATLDFSLEVIDADGLTSAPTTARVIVSDVPVARFVPDGGLVFGGQTLVMQSTSFDDGGLLLTSYDWRLGAGSAATLVTDGGTTASVTFTPLMPGDADRLARVELQVTNAVGATSSVFARDFTVRAGNTTNWTVSIAPVSPVNVTAAPPPTVNLAATFTLPTGAPTPSVSWTCGPNVAVVGSTSLNPSFIAPVPNGPGVVVNCTVLATGVAPLQPLMQSANVVVALNDLRPPTLLPFEEDRYPTWGRTFRFSEPMSSGAFNTSGCAGNGISITLLMLGSTGIPFVSSNTLPTSCNASNLSGADRSGNTLNFNGGPIFTGVVWEGPFISTALFDDPRPVLPSISQSPAGSYELAGTPLPHPPGVELIASAPGTIYRFAIDPAVADAGCNPSCPLVASSLSAPWVTGGDIMQRRAFATSDSMFVSFKTDAGFALLERASDGGLVGPIAVPGTPILSRTGTSTNLDSLEFNGGALDRWRWDAAARQWNRGDRIATGLASAEELTGNEKQVMALVGASRTLTVWTFGINPAVNPTVAQWHNFPTPAQLASAPAMRDTQAGFVNLSSTIFGVFYARANGSIGLYRLFDLTNQFGNPFVGDRNWGSTVASNGFDWLSRGDPTIGVRAENGQIILSTIDYSAMASSGPSTTLAGPTRPGPGPYPNSLNADLACEAAYPRLAMVDDRLFITWQERCAPETRWRVVLRVMR